MKWRGIILTGTSGAGKSTISNKLQTSFPMFEQVRSVTTRAKRADDEPGTYEYISEEEFENLSKSLLIWAGYRGKRYGIRNEHLSEVEERGKTPILVITSKSHAEYCEREGENGLPLFMSVFIDAPDEVLNSRLGMRDNPEQIISVLSQRIADREYSHSCKFLLENIDLDQSFEQLLSWWENPIGRSPIV